MQGEGDLDPGHAYVRLLDLAQLEAAQLGATLLALLPRHLVRGRVRVRVRVRDRGRGRAGAGVRARVRDSPRRSAPAAANPLPW